MSELKTQYDFEGRSLFVTESNSIEIYILNVKGTTAHRFLNRKKQHTLIITKRPKGLFQRWVDNQ